MEIVIRSEEDAWRWLKLATDNAPELARQTEPIDLRFEGWPSLDLRFKGHDFDSSVPTRIMPPLLDAQKEVYRLFCQVRYGEPNLRKLKSDDRDRLELVVKVEEGSSEYETNLQDALTEIAKSAVANMDSIHILVTVISAALIFGSVVAWKAWLKSKEKQLEIESRVKMSDLEAKKLQILQRATHQHPEIREFAAGVDEFRNDSLNQLRPSDKFEVPNSDVKVDGQYAAEITHKPREQSIENRLDGDFIILSVVSGDTDGFRIKVRRVDDGQIVNVNIPDGTLSPFELEILKNSEWAKSPVKMEMNVRILRGMLTSATLLSASKIKRG